MNSILGIDFGRKKVGLAIADSKGISIQPLNILKFQSKTFWKQLKDIIHNHMPFKIIIGFPNSILNQEVLDFKIHLSKIIPQEISIHLINESFSTQEANEIYHAMYPNKKIKNKLDSLAAAIILKRFLSLSKL